jgi:peptidyl-tRNA hydrolase, PTH1 family
MNRFLIIGLGNPGEAYENTRHNIGFSILDRLAFKLQKEEPGPSPIFTSDKHAMVHQAKYKGHALVLIKPTTYMNLSGKAVQYWMQKEKISIHHLLVVTDDLALPFGALRMKKKGSDGGHNGLKDIIATLNSDAFCRLRFGIDATFGKGKQSDYVLGKWNGEELETLEERIAQAIAFIQSYCTIGPDRSMSVFNNK